jgi:predicted enzyme related to lactoylglutathione lyase
MAFLYIINLEKIMAKNIKLIVYPVADIEKAKAFYSQFLEAEPYADSPYYIGYKVGDLEIGLDPNSKVGPISYIDVADIKAGLEKLIAAGGAVVQEPKDVGGGLLIAQVKDPDDNVVGLRQQA